MQRCPVCNQLLPDALDPEKLQRKLEGITSKARARERQMLEQDFRERMSERLASERKQMRRIVERDFRRQLVEANRRADRADADSRREVERLRSEMERRSHHAAKTAARLAVRESQAEIEKLSVAREKDHVRHEAERAKLLGQVEQFKRRLEKQSADELGTGAEIDLLADLRAAFPRDKIEPIRRGVRGADIIQEVREDGKLLGRIVFESKNVSGWSNSWVTKAKSYQTKYETPHVLIVSRSFPKKKTGLCAVKEIPVVDPRMAVPLASIVRDGICEVGELRITQVGRVEKAHELYEYILSEKFATRFREIADSVGCLREHQQKEKNWHEDNWELETKLHEKIETRRREVDSQIRVIVRKTARPQVVRISARS